MNYNITLLLGFVVVACALAFVAAAPEGKVTGGSNAARNQFPHQVSFQWGLLGIWQHVCGGIVLTNNRILTAGHCITETPGIGSFRIRAGILNLNENVATLQQITVASNVVHPNYAGGVNPNDLAILRLSTSLSWTAAVQPINLPAAGSIPTGNVVLSGWGSTSTTQTPIMPNTLQTVTKPVLTITACRNALIALMGNAGPLADSNVCTGPLTGGVSACSGDSGGPLIQGNTLIGVVSWGIMPCGTVGAPSVYVRVSAFNAWINSLL